MNTITEMKNTLEGINSRITKAEEWKTKTECGNTGQGTGFKKKKLKKIKDRPRELCNNTKYTNIQNTGS